MRIDILTLFPEMCERVLGESVIGRARAAGLMDLRCHNIRDYTRDKHNRVDDAPYGGGMGMIMQTQPIYDCFMRVWRDAGPPSAEEIAADLPEEMPPAGKKPHLIYLSPKGTVLTQQRAAQLASYDRLVLLCGHYEGVDQRVLDELVDEEISIGDYVLTGGELPALVLTDAVCRMLPGVLSSDVCFTEESHFSGLLEYPHYTRPAEWRGREVPEVLLSGHHANIERWRREEALRITLEKRPDLLEKVELDDKDRAFLNSLPSVDGHISGRDAMDSR